MFYQHKIHRLPFQLGAAHVNYHQHVGYHRDAQYKGDYHGLGGLRQQPHAAAEHVFFYIAFGGGGCNNGELNGCWEGCLVVGVGGGVVAVFLPGIGGQQDAQQAVGCCRRHRSRPWGSEFTVLQLF